MKPVRSSSAGSLRVHDDRAGAEGDDEGRCFAASGARGAWLVEWAPARKVKEAALTFTARPWSLVYIDPDGHALHTGGPEGVVALLEHEWTGRTTILAVHDFDDDGLPEVLLGNERYTALEGYRDEVTAWSVHPDGEPPIRRYRPDLAQRGWVDLDHDGRPELLLTPRPGTATYAILHGLASGRFAADDDFARAGLAAICPAPSPPGTKLSSPRAALCAFHWGTPRDRLLAQLDATDVEVELVCKQAMREAVPSDEPPLLVGACPSDRPSVEAGRQRNLGDPCP